MIAPKCFLGAFMSSRVPAFDHIHPVSSNPRETAQWHVDHLRDEITRVVVELVSRSGA
jgi:hypothetical protein